MSEDGENTDEEQTLKKEQLENVRLGNDKLRLEIKKQEGIFDQVSRILPVISTLIGVAVFGTGIFQYRTQEIENRRAQKAQADQEHKTAEQERMKPWRESQREIYNQALSEASLAANTNDVGRRSQAVENFFSLFYGKMILVETTGVSEDMTEVGNCLDGTEVCSKGDTNDRILILGTDMHESMAAMADMTYEQFAKNQFKYRNKLNDTPTVAPTPTPTQAPTKVQGNKR